ncbi:MAG: dTDP-4-dehydrorhamnose reductase [Methanothrix sp.]|jgi:dTDP-4-dehydrorhamnose reductase|uniref:dTDP-4-dehydrorhamnose reductase n=1 Tax=Methanothrix sp. TaxID=90426 RepID=UPI001BD5AC59
MKIFITGGSGLAGSRLAEMALARGDEVFSGYAHNRPACGRGVRLDLLDPDGIRDIIERTRPDAIVHSAALTDVDRCEREKDLAFKINVEGTRAVAEGARAAGSFLVYVSTDYVFDGRRGLYREGDQTGPVSYYGLSKLLGEELSLDQGCVARTCVIYGRRPASGKVNFALWILNSLGSGKEISVVTDQFITPTLNSNLAAMLLEAADRQLSGIYHLSGASRVSRYDFACQLADTFELDSRLILPSRMSDLDWLAERPKDSSLDTSKARQMLKNGPLPLNDSLQLLKKEIIEG